MRKVVGILLIIFGCASAVPAYYFAKEYSKLKTLDFAEEEKMMIADCKKKFLPSVGADKETSHTSDEIDNCIERGWRSIGLISPFIALGMLVFLILSVISLSLSWWVIGKNRSILSIGILLFANLCFIYFVTTSTPTTISKLLNW